MTTQIMSISNHPIIGKNTNKLTKNGGLFKKAMLDNALKALAKDVQNYLYEYDPNFDFKNETVQTPRNSNKKVKKQQIGMYYQTNMNIDPSTSTVDTYSIDDFTDEDMSYSRYEEESKTSRKNYKKPSRKPISDIHLTKGLEIDIGPDKMKPRPEKKLMEVSEAENYTVSLKDFEKNKILVGEGAFGEVYLVCCKLNGMKYALKVLNKAKVKEAGCERHLMREKEISTLLDHPNIARLEAYFQDSENCYFLFELCQVGDLNTFIKDHKRLSVKLTRQWVMEIINALEHLRDNNIVHRDLKPKNILLDDTFHLKLADMGAAKEIDPEALEKEMDSLNFNSDDESIESSDNSDEEDSDSNSSDSDSSKESSDSEALSDTEDRKAQLLSSQRTQIGTAFYISPEMIRYQIACFGSDLWALGCIIYECLVGKSPFVGRNSFEVQDKILNAEFSFPSKFNANAKDLICKLLKVVPTERLGAGLDGSDNDFEALKAHPFFKGKRFDRCARRKPIIETHKGGFNSSKYVCKFEDVFSEGSLTDTRSTSLRSSQFTKDRSKFSIDSYSSKGKKEAFS